MHEKYDPVTIADLIAGNHGLTAHCRNCGHWKSLKLQSLPLLPEKAIPELERAFKCSLCGSRNTCAMPDYRNNLDKARPAAVGWIMPPAQ